ncbi:MAG: preprotein translocase subunit SecA, partial [Opitutales bacterium]|nr:preprotein translocase subunit SecA [Opitutales bacterium]
EFFDIYRLGVVAIPTNTPCIRIDEDDTIFKTRREKYAEAVKEIKVAHERGQPVLVGTASVEASEMLSRSLKYAGVPHNVLNAKNHEIEAQIVAQAGQRGAVTIATNMAGRGTDIKLGEGVRELGGLFVLGTERHESRRVDRQLRGRCSRQGDPGRSKFLVSLEDDLMRLFSNAGVISRVLQKSFVEGQPLQHSLLNRSIETAQRRVEAVHYAYRKNTLQYDDVFNKQREIIYGIRNEALKTENPRDLLFALVDEELNERVDSAIPADEKSDVNQVVLEDFVRWLNTTFPIRFTAEELLAARDEGAANLVVDRVRKAYSERDSFEGADALKGMERYIILRAIDKNWQDHLAEMADLRQSIGLRGYGQRNPLVEYKNEAFSCFKTMLGRVRTDVCTGLFRSATSYEAFEQLIRRLRGIEIPEETPDAADVPVKPASAIEKSPAAAALFGSVASAEPAPATENESGVPANLPSEIGRNDLVEISLNGETRIAKWKKAQALIANEGWTFVKRV